MNIIYYTSGIPGTGRIVWGISIFNALRRKNIDCEFSIVSSSDQGRLCGRFGIPHKEIPRADEHELSHENCRDSALYKTIIGLNPDVLVVDRMWFTLYHFIDELPCKKIYFSQQVDKLFYSIKTSSVELTFNRGQYDQILAIEPYRDEILKENINPLIIRNREEILDRETALKKLELSGDKQVCLIALNYKDGYFENMKDKYSYLKEEGYDVIETSNLKGGGIFPIVDYFNAIDFIVCAAGYTQFWEVIYFNKEAVFETFPLHFTSMKWRIENCQEYNFEENGADQLVDIIMNL